MTDAEYVKSILADVSSQLMDLLQKLKEEQDSFSAMGIDYEEKAFYDILIAVAENFQFEFPESKNIELAKEIRQTGIVEVKRYNGYRSKAIDLLDHAASDTDKEVLIRHYVHKQEYFDIAEEMFYSYSYIMHKVRNALKRLAANLKDVPAGNY